MNILQMLQESDPALLNALAEVWSVKLEPRAAVNTIVNELFHAMTNPERVEVVWDTLDDKARGAMQLLIASGGTMAQAKFMQVFGEFQRMGAGMLKREKPHKNPKNVAEALYYRGLIGLSFENTDMPRTIVTIPSDLVAVLPLNKTAYSKLDDEEDDFPDEDDEDGFEAEDNVEEAETLQPTITTLEPIDSAVVKHARQADTSLVDDMTTLLAYLRIHTPILEGEMFSGSDMMTLDRHLLTTGEERQRFMLAMGRSADLIEVNNGRAVPSRTGAPKWLGKTRHEQVKTLAESWKTSPIVKDLWHVPGLRVDPDAGMMPHYDPAVARRAILSIMTKLLSPNEWWSVDDFIELVRQDYEDFQRPNGDFTSWYIYDDDDVLLSGVENWYSIEGAMLEYVITGPMHWLGLLDLGDDAARLTAYGRAFLGMAQYPAQAEAADPILVDPDGTLRVSRKVSRADRYQVARFSSWVTAGNVFAYKLDRQGIAQAESQGINVGHITVFVKRALGDKPLPDGVSRLLEGKAAATEAIKQTNTSVTLEQLLVLRTTAPETTDYIFDTPALRRYVGAKLGEMALVVRAQDIQAFVDALEEHGIRADFRD